MHKHSDQIWPQNIKYTSADSRYHMMNVAVISMIFIHESCMEQKLPVMAIKMLTIIT